MMPSKMLHRLIAKFGYVVAKPFQIEALRIGYGMDKGLESLKSKKNIAPATIVDIGAAAGTWAAKAIRIWPECSFVLFEPLVEREKELKTFQETYPRSEIDIKIGAVGHSHGHVALNVSEDLDGSGIYGEETGNARTVPLYSLNESCRHLQAPYLLKLDTHGFEQPIFEGASEILKNTVAIVIEVYGFNISSTAMRFHEMTFYLEEKGFRLADMLDIMRRPKDEVFWQADFVFLRKEHPVFLLETYK